MVTREGGNHQQYIGKGGITLHCGGVKESCCSEGGSNHVRLGGGESGCRGEFGEELHCKGGIRNHIRGGRGIIIMEGEGGWKMFHGEQGNPGMLQCVRGGGGGGGGTWIRESKGKEGESYCWGLSLVGEESHCRGKEEGRGRCQKSDCKGNRIT